MNNSEESKNEKQIGNNEREQHKVKSEIKVNRIHRINPGNSINLKISLTDKKKDVENYNSARHFSSNFKYKKKDFQELLYKDEIDKEIQKRKNIYNEFVLLYKKMKIDRLLEEESSNECDDTIENSNSIYKKENLTYYIINRTWFNQFKNYCLNHNLSHSNLNEDYPGQINNQHLILNDDKCLKLLSDNRIIINSKYLDNCTCISEDMWHFLVKISGGGPEIKFISNRMNNEPNKSEGVEVIRRCVHVNLLFIPKKEIISNNSNKEPSNNINDPLNPFQSQEIKKILVNNEEKNQIHIEYIYFDITKNVQDLINYINQILNQHRNKFTNTPICFGPNYNSERNNCLVENINYRLWLNDINVSAAELANFITEQINKYEDADFPISFNKMNNINDNYFQPYLLSQFAEYKIYDIFPNKYTKNFNNTNFYDTKCEDENSMPTITILSEEYPYHFESSKRTFYIKKCNYCHCRDYVFVGCICQKVFYCSEDCKKKDFTNHIVSCIKGLYKLLDQKNENLYRIIKARKEHYEQNKNEEQNFPILGLTNLGNTCYMNSSLQCLFAIKELTNYFLYYFKEDHLNKGNVLGTGGALTIAYINLLLNINNTTNNKYLSPDSFKIILGLCSKKYEGNEQEDAHEFLNYLLDMLHEDLNRVINKPNINENDNIENINMINLNITDKEKSNLDWNNFLKRNQSVLIDIFYGQYKSCVICPKCEFKSVSFNSFLSLELPIMENKNYIPISVYFLDFYKDSPILFFTVILFKNEQKIYFLRKKISILLEIDILEFELLYQNNGEIIHIFDINEDVPNNIQCVYAYKINPMIFYSKNNLRIKNIMNDENKNIEEYAKSKLRYNYDNLQYNITRRIDKIIELYDNKNIKDDLFYLSLKHNDNLGLDNQYYQRAILESKIVKHHKIKNFDVEDMLYLEKNKNCVEIYSEIFKKYAVNLAFKNLPKNFPLIFQIFNSGEIEKINNMFNKLFIHFFKNAKIDSSKLDIVNDFPECPFILFLSNKKYNIFELIPFNSNINYNDVLNRFYLKINSEKNKNNDIINNNFFNEQENDKLNNQNININIDNYGDIINEILNDNINMNDIENNKNNDNSNNDEDNSNNSDINNKNNGNKGGLPGGGNLTDKKNKDENDKENNEENENENENENNSGSESSDESDTDNENGHYNNENSDEEIEKENNSTQNINSNSNSCSNSKRSKHIMDENILNETEKDENVDRILIMWNSKYIKNFTRKNDINLNDICERLYENNSKEKISLEKCFNEFSKEEKLDNDNLWNCPNCNERLQANKKIELYNLPKILIIHLKRFNNNKKINSLIDFPIKDLDLDKYISKEKDKDENNKYMSETKYDLFGVVNHYGSLEYGHYTSFCKNQHNSNWYEYNDRIVNEIQIEKEEETIVNPNAYILFYRQQNNDKIKWENIYNKKYEDINQNNLKLFGQDFIYEENETKNEKETDKIDLDIEIDNDKKTGDNKEIILTNYERIREEKNDDNFSFREGANNYIDTNENENENEKEKTAFNLELSDIQTPKFKDNNDSNRIEINNSVKGAINFSEIRKDNKDNIAEKNKYQTEFKAKSSNNNNSFFKNIIRTNKNIIRIKTYKKVRKNKNINININSPITNNIISNSNSNNNINKNEDIITSNKKEEEKIENIDTSPNNIDNKNNKSNSATNELVQYNLFNKSKSYFKIELKKNKKSSFNSVKSKELTNFLLKEYSDDMSDKVPRSKKLYNDSNLDTEAKLSNSIILNNEDETKEKEKEKEKEKKVVAIKEEESDNLKYVNKDEIDLEDYVYNPFRDCFAKLRKYGK